MPSRIKESEILDGMVWVHGERSIVRFDRRYTVTPERLWEAITQPELVAGWLGVVDRYDLQVGGEIALLLHPDKGAWLRGTILDIEAPRLVEFTWTVPAHGTVPEFTGSSVRLEVYPDALGSRLSFVHFLPDSRRVFDILAASHLRLNQLPPAKGQRALVDRERFLTMRARYEEKTVCKPS
ncbi:SRPBCC domain-containing protein [Pendulispora rubella]|uniref:SRPBCC domain-containing protein n=1 Tax=Pendulispora rubella TaxID=2741070 RepID=A0ABZ2LIN2_9BACT